MSSAASDPRAAAKPGGGSGGGGPDYDDERHRRDELERRSRRKSARESRSGKSDEKQRMRKEHSRRVLGEQAASRPSGSDRHRQRSRERSGSGGGDRSKSRDSADAKAAAAGGSSAFRLLFSKRSEGFLLDLRFRNAPPRPPVGPCFVGPGLEGELTDKWTRYKARNAVERGHVWGLHSEPDLGVPLAASAMDWEGCYTDPAKKKKKGEKGGDDDEGGEGEDDIDDGGPDIIPERLHPHDEALLDWTGSKGDSAAEELQVRRDKARAAARASQQLATPTKVGRTDAAPSSSAAAAPPGISAGIRLKSKKNQPHSRILDEKLPHFMKKTTYLTNDLGSVHKFTSLAKTKAENALEVDRKLDVARGKSGGGGSAVDASFDSALAYDGEGIETRADGRKRRRVHPTKKGIFPVWDRPLLPDAKTWGYTYTHVVLDHAPRSANDGKKRKKKKKDPDANDTGENLATANQLKRAIVADVAKRDQNAKMACTVWVPSGEKDEEKKKNDEKGQIPFRPVQRYDLDVVPLREADGPRVHFVWIVDDSKPYVSYVPVGSRVQLSTGRPVVVAGGSDGDGNGGGGGAGENGEYFAGNTVVSRRPPGNKDIREMEAKKAELDEGAAERHDSDDDDEGGETRRKVSRGADGGREKRKVDEDSDSDDSGDAF